MKSLKSHKNEKNCRACGGQLTKIFDIGTQALTGRFPKSPQEKITKGPVTLKMCEDGCGLVQLGETYNLGDMYGENYGYRSGLNVSMVRHLGEKVAEIKKIIKLQPGDLVIDIGSNDGTTLSFYDHELVRCGVDPTANKFKSYYEKDIIIIPDFFSEKKITEVIEGKKAKIITSFSMLYDLPEPKKFFKEISNVLDDNGIWVFEQSYLPLMLLTNSFDTICQEHLEYYSLSSIEYLAEQSNLEIIDVSLNDTNGGSFSVIAAKKGNKDLIRNWTNISNLKYIENSFNLKNKETYISFLDRIDKEKSKLLNYLREQKNNGNKVYGLGASTKGNVLLQYFGIDETLLPKIAEINPDKFGKFTPGSNIEILSEHEARKKGITTFLVLPWHFKRHFMAGNFEGCKLIFPLPTFHVVEL
jgi:NDP-4-keto-2,6-dideoxyhexose 3-C-methyltransferase